MTSQIIFEQKLPQALFQTFDSRPDFAVHEVTQVHGDKVIGCGNNNVLADGLFTKNKSFALAIKTADCLPIAVIGERGVALLHAGWKGIKLNIFCHKNILDIRPEYFFLGPAIHWQNYAVQEDFLAHFPHSQSIITKNGQYFFDIYGEAINRIKNAYPLATIQGIDSPCTFACTKYHSYRRDKTELRNWNILKSHL